MMDPTLQSLESASSEELAGDAAPLAQALGEPEILASLTALAELVNMSRPQSLQGVGAFLARYRDRLLAPIELPAIRDAYLHAARGEVRELVELDRRLAPHFGSSAFTEASRFAGRIQLRRLRPVRHTTLQRYLRAVESGEATGWHVVVFGVLLALFSLPLRQGLAHYASKTQESLLDSASAGLSITAAHHRQLFEECLEPIQRTIQGILPPFTPQAGSE